MKQMNFSARAQDRIRKVARTPADLGRSGDIGPEGILEVTGFRSLGRNLIS